MELTILGSSSSGNCYVLQNDKEALIIEAGIHIREVLSALNYNVKKVVGCIVTHEHGDHAKYINQHCEYAIPIYTSAGTIDAVKDSITTLECLHSLNPLEEYRIGNFTILPFDVRHDAVEPFGYLISHPETGTILFATDTYYLPYTFKGLRTVMIECNYVLDILNSNIENGLVIKKVADRVLESHMSLTNCIEALQANDLSLCNKVILLHKSAGNGGNSADIVRKVVESIAKPVIVAEKGLKLEITKEAF